MRKTDSVQERWVSYLKYLSLILVLAAVGCARVRLLALPLERNEGEYA